MQILQLLVSLALLLALAAPSLTRAQQPGAQTNNFGGWKKGLKVWNNFEQIANSRLNRAVSKGTGHGIPDLNQLLLEKYRVALRYLLSQIEFKTPNSDLQNLEQIWRKV